MQRSSLSPNGSESIRDEPVRDDVNGAGWSREKLLSRYVLPATECWISGTRSGLTTGGCCTLHSYKKLQVAEEKAVAENQRLQREIYALVTYPHDITEERRNQEREKYDSICK